MCLGVLQQAQEARKQLAYESEGLGHAPIISTTDRANRTPDPGLCHPCGHFCRLLLRGVRSLQAFHSADGRGRVASDY